MREIIFDTETTGFDPHSGDRMVEIGCIEMIDRVMTGETFHCYFNPQRAMPSGAEQVHGLSEKFLSDKPLFVQKAQEMLRFLGDAPLVAHNASFDFGFLNMELEKSGNTPIHLDRMIDTIAIARVKHPGAKMSLDALCTRYGIDRSHRVKHGALLDAELLAHLYIELTGGRQIGLGLSNDDELTDGQSSYDARNLVKDRPFRAARPHAPLPEELARHNQFMETIKDAIWRDTGRQGEKIGVSGE
jgi:DNA polymerase III subunit epsilon